MIRLYRLSILFSLLVLVGVAASRSARGAETPAPADPNSTALTIASQYGAWEQWGPTSPPNTFDINQCLPMRVGDINGDGLSDLICPRYLGDFIPTTYTYVQLATPTGFSDWQQASPRNDDDNFTLIYCATIFGGDVNGDMLTDLICPYDHGQASTTTYVQLADGTGFGDWQAFSPTQPLFTFEIGQCDKLQVGDVNGDGYTDLICPYDYSGGATTTFVQIGDPGGFSAWLQSGPANPPGTFEMSQCYTLQVGDVNGDGNTDLICPYNYGGTTTTFVKTGDMGGFSGWEPSGPTFAAFDLTKCSPPRVGDANGDGLTDLICPYDMGGGSMTVYVQLAGPGGFSEWQQSGPTNPAGTFNLSQCRTRQVGDVNGDGVTDLICPYDYGGTTTTWVKEGSAEGYSEWLPSAYEYFDFDLAGCYAVYPGDLNGDGLTDLICPYDYGESSTATFVQLREVTSFEIYAPIIVR